VWVLSWWLDSAHRNEARVYTCEKHRHRALNDNCLALKRELLFLHSTSEATVEELLTEVMGEIIIQVAGSVLSAERERVKEERRRVEEER